MSQDNTPLNPVEVEQRIGKLTNRIAQGVAVYSKAYRDFMEADREYDLAVAKARFSYEGTAQDKKDYAEIQTTALREMRDVSEAAFKHSDKLLRALESELSAYQSISASVRAMYGASGRGV